MFAEKKPPEGETKIAGEKVAEEEHI